MNQPEPFPEFAPYADEQTQGKPIQEIHLDAAFPFVAVSDLKYSPPEFIVDGLFETETLGLIFGDPACGKSFLAVDIALSVATGTQFHGRDVRQGSVFFIAGEGHNGLARRFEAWSKDKGVSLAGVPLFKSERAAQFLDPASVKAVSDAVASLANQHGAPSLIIIDTLARNFGAGDENSTKDMSEFITAVDDFKARFPCSAVLVVHHTGHSEKGRARGAYALKGGLDAEFRVEKDENDIRLVNLKMKDAPLADDAHFKLSEIELGLTAKGEPFGSAVLEATEAPEKKRNLTPNQRLAQATYADAAVKHGVWDDGAFLGVHVNEWRKTFYAKHTGDTTDAKQKAFQRARKDVTDNGMMTVQDDVYLTRDGTLQITIMEKADGQDIAGHS